MMRKLGMAAFLAAMGLVVAAPSTEAAPTEPTALHGACGDGQCSPPEDCNSCPQDCGSCCGNNHCEPPEDCHSCPHDCGSCK
ncbi:MAG TPA: hypothetical protein VGH28_01020 [Polyangiaceae bacterium]|jgi:hypothetical protein